MELGRDRPPGIRPSAPYFPEIDCLRGLAVLLVVASHIATSFAGGEPVRSVSPWAAFLWSGHTGIALLFVLTGFLLSLPFLAEARGGPSVSPLGFYARRALRVLPPYYAAVIIGTALSATSVADLPNALPYLWFLNSFAGIAKPLGTYSAAFWSIETSVQFILVVPLLGFLLRSRPGRLAGIGLLYVYALLIAAFLLGRLRMDSIDGQLKLASSLFGRGYQFLMGTAAAWVYLRFADRLRGRFSRSALAQRGGGDVALLVVVAALSLVLRWCARMGALQAEVAPYHAWHLAEGALWTAVLLLVLLAPLRSRPLLVNSPFRGLGLIAYSLYLVHVPLIFIAWARLREWEAAGAGGFVTTAGTVAGLVVACLGLAMISWWLIERPCLVRKAQIQ